MATKRKSVQIVRRAAVVPKATLVKVQQASLAKARRAREVAAARTGTIIGSTVAAAAGYIERERKLEPKWTSPLAFSVGGVVCAFVLPETSLGRGKVGSFFAEAGSALLAVGAYKAGLGQPIVGEDEGVQGDWGPG